MLVCAFAVLCTFVASAQSKNADMQGYVKNIDNQPVAYASVALLKASDSTVIKFAVTNQTGLFKFNAIAPGKYWVKVSCTGYAAKLTPVTFLGSSINFNIVTIQLRKSNADLAEIAVVESKSFVEVRPGKTTLNIQNSAFAVGSTALDILKMSPGVQISNTDEVSLNGKTDVLILIDNKPTYLSGAALADLLHGTQSSMISKIEISNNPNSTYDAASAGGVINIKMVRDKNLGFNAQVNAGGGVTVPGINNYDAAGKGVAGINFNYRTKKLNVFGNYSYSNLAYFKSSTSSRVNNYNGVVDLISDDWVINQRRVSNNFRFGADYNINSQHVIGFLLTGMFMDLNGPKNTISTINSVSNTDSSILTNSILKRWQSNLTYNSNYRGSLGKYGDITVDADYINYNRGYAENFLSNYFYGNDVLYRNAVFQNNSPLNYDVYVFNANYRINLNTSNNLMVGFKDSYAKTDNFYDFGYVTNGIYNPLPLFTGRFKYTEKLYAGYVDYNHIFSKKTSLELGLRVEQTISDGVTPSLSESVHNNYIDFFPNVQFNHIIDNDNQLKFSYRRSISRPKYEELNPFLLYNDQYTYQIGNRYLKPSYTNTIAIDHVYKNKFSTAASFTVVNGFPLVVYIQDDKTQITTLKKINLGNRYNYDLVFTAPITFTKWYSADFNLDLLYQRFTGMNGALDNGSADITLKIIQHFKLPFSMKADLIAQYETPTTYGIFRYKSNFFAFGSISKSVLKNKGTIQFMVDNIFQSDKNVYTSHYQNLNISGTQVNIFRAFQLNFIYVLGSQTVKAARKSTGADEEQIRVGNGAN